MKINAFLAIRLGSQRIPYKNFRLLAGKPLYTYLADTAKNCQQISHLFINTDSQMVIDIVQNKYGDTISYYLRPTWLGTSEATIDDYVYDFMSVNHADYTVFLNPCSIFLKAETIDKQSPIALLIRLLRRAVMKYKHIVSITIILSISLSPQNSLVRKILLLFMQ